MPKIIVITGANRGIGLALATHLNNAGHSIIATARTPSAAHQLAALPNILGIVRAEMADLASLEGVAAEIAKLAPDGIDELWNNAGQSLNHAPMPSINPLTFHTELAVNVVAPSALTAHLLPLLHKRDTKKIVFISSAMGSLTLASRFIGASLKGENPTVTEDFFVGSAYSTAKTALTMQALGWHGALWADGFTVLAIHPGWVQTDLTGGPGRAALTTDEAVPKIIETVTAAERSEDFKLLNYNGAVLPW